MQKVVKGLSTEYSNNKCERSYYAFHILYDLISLHYHPATGKGLHLTWPPPALLSKLAVSCLIHIPVSHQN